MERLARWCHRRRRAVLLLWVLVVAGTVAAAANVGSDPVNDFTVPDTESQRAVDVLRERFPARAGDTANVVFRAEDGVRDPAVQERVEQALLHLSVLEHVQDVMSPYDPATPTVSADGAIAFAVVQFDVESPDIPARVADEVREIVAGASAPGLQVEVGGQALRFAGREGPSRSELVGIVAAVVVLLFTFGSVVAAGLPILTALFALGFGLALIALVTNVVDIPDFAPQVATMIGLGVGIDYALLIVTRFRQGLHGGLSSEDATAVAMTTSGRAVLFAGTTVVISMSGLFLMGMPIFHGLAFGAITAVVLTMVAATTLLPAVLGFAGPAVDKLPIGRGRRETGHRGSAWFRWSRLVQRRPWPAVVAGAGLLLLLAVPALSMRLGSVDDGTEPTSSTFRRAYDLLAEGFGPGFNGPFLAVVELPGPGETEATDRLVEAFAAADGVALVAPPELNPDGDTAMVAVIPETSPQSEATDRLFHHLRRDVAPAAVEGTGARVFFGGITAASIDVADLVGDRLGVFMGGVLVLSFLLLLVVFRSVLVPVKAVLVNLLSIGAAYGIVVAVFQWGWAKELIGIDRTGPILSMVPMWLFAILFGLSMDYEVFLISRIQEEYLRTGDNGLAVADGLAVTARVITAAATIMVTVFASFVLNDDRILKLFGVGLASAIFLDAVVVRTLLVPATMELLGRANWWLPRWLDRIIPHVSVEREGVVARHVLEEEVREELGEVELVEPAARPSSPSSSSSSSSPDHPG